jgi:hypothetical protein
MNVKSRRKAVGSESDWVRRDEQLWFAQLLCTGDVCRVSGERSANVDSIGRGPRFFYSVTRDTAKGMVYLKLVNANSTAQSVKIDFSGASTIAGTGRLVTLSGANPAETNTISVPTRIVPVKTELKGAASSFSHTVPGYAVQVLEIQRSNRDAGQIFELIRHRRYLCR